MDAHLRVQARSEGAFTQQQIEQQGVRVIIATT